MSELTVLDTGKVIAGRSGLNKEPVAEQERDLDALWPGQDRKSVV